jgi:hypothetical protein
MLHRNAALRFDPLQGCFLNEIHFQPKILTVMKTKLMLAALLASAAITQASPPISPAKIKKPLRISQITSIFPQAPPSAPAQPASAGTGGAASSNAGASSTAAPVAEPKISKRAKARTFLNHPVTAPGPH